MYNISVYSYDNGRIRIKYENQKESHDLTLNLKDVYLEDSKVFLDPFIQKNNLLKDLKKSKIIKEVNQIINYNYIDIPVATLNMGILRRYDSIGVNNYIKRKIYGEK